MNISGKVKKISFEGWIALSIMLAGLIMSFLITTWQVPDENTHLSRIEYSISNSDFFDKLVNSVGIQMNRLEWDTTQRVDRQELADAMQKTPDYTRAEGMPKGFTLEVLQRLPATIGLLLGILLGLPTFWTLQLGELFALGFYAFICYRALKLMPFKKHIMAIFMLCPMALQEAGSVSYDAVVIPLVYYFIAYILNLKFAREKIELKDMLLLLVSWAVISMAKPPYVFLILLFLILPLNKFHIKIGKFEINEQLIRKVRIPIVIVGGVAGVCLIYLLRDNLWIQIVYATIREWKRTIYLLWSTIRTFGKYLMISSVGNFGWLTVSVTFAFAVFFYLYTFVLSMVGEKRNAVFRKWDYVILFVTFLILVYFTTISMAHHTIMITLFGDQNAPAVYNARAALYQIPYIGGLQGRYFLPLLTLFFIPIQGVTNGNKKVVNLSFVLFECVTLGYSFYLLLQRFWIPV